MDLGLSGKRALVTGGSSGIGAAIAVGLAREGCDLAFTHLKDGDDAAETARQVESLDRTCVVFESDVADTEAAKRTVAEAAERLGGLDLLVCNAGITSDAVIWKMDEEQWDRVLDVNLKGTWNYCRAVAKIFKEQRGGKIVNVASINGLRGKFGQSNYTASKGGVIALTKTVARELGRYDVNVNVIAPGMVVTRMMREVPREFHLAAEEESVLGRIAQPADVASVAVFLCSDAARHLTGQVIQVDGGQNI